MCNAYMIDESSIQQLQEIILLTNETLSLIFNPSSIPATRRYISLFLCNVGQEREREREMRNSYPGEDNARAKW